MLLAQNTEFCFSIECMHAFNILKQAFVIVSILQPPDWVLLLDLMYNTSDCVMGDVLIEKRQSNSYNLLCL